MVIATSAFLLSGLAQAQDMPPQDDIAAETEAVSPPVSVRRGKVTNRKIPRFVSMKASAGRARRGPSFGHRIDWVYTQKGLPLMITDEFGNWRRVEAIDGSGGWMHHGLLSGARFVMMTEDNVEIRVRSSEKSAVRAIAKKYVVARLKECTVKFCRVSAGKYIGWVLKTKIWGLYQDEMD